MYELNLDYRQVFIAQMNIIAGEIYSNSLPKYVLIFFFV